jgi:hypothetical protein
VLIDDVNEFKLPVEVSIKDTLVNILPVVVSKEPNLLFWFESVVAIELLNEPILEDILELNVE